MHNSESDDLFIGDFFKRQKLTQQLSKYLDILKGGTVIAIDAPWGSGKTWFGTNWKKYLEKQHKVIFIDAFKHDYIEDPFVLIAAEITTLVKNSNSGAADALKNEAYAVTKVLMPHVTKMLINGIGKFILGVTNLKEVTEDAIKQLNNDISSDASDWVKQRFDEHEEEKKSFKKYNEALTEYCANQSKPVVIFIDELDRCKPTFAIKLIERIKHFFDVPGLVFILLMNRKQLENALEKYYGTSTYDAKEYLGKFINLYLTLPKYKLNVEDTENISDISKFVESSLAKFNLSEINEVKLKDFNTHLSIWVFIKSFSLRQIERACILFAITEAKGNIPFVTFLIMVKQTNPEAFKAIAQGLRENSTSGNTENHIDMVTRDIENSLKLFKGVNLDSLEESRTNKQYIMQYLYVLRDLLLLLKDSEREGQYLKRYQNYVLGINLNKNRDQIRNFFIKNINLVDLSIDVNN